MTNLTNRRVLAVLFSVAVVGAGAVGVASAASNGSVSASPPTAGAESTHTVTVTIGNASAGSWNGLRVDYSESDADVADVGTGDVTKVGIDRGNDANGATIDESVSGDLSAVQTSNEGETLTVQLGGSYQLNPGDEVVVVIESVQNPSEAAEYTVPLDVNPQSSGGDAQALLAIDAGSDQQTTESDGGSGGVVPGFGVGVALAAVAAGALLAARE